MPNSPRDPLTLAELMDWEAMYRRRFTPWQVGEHVYYWQGSRPPYLEYRAEIVALYPSGRVGIQVHHWHDKRDGGLRVVRDYSLSRISYITAGYEAVKTIEYILRKAA